MEGLIPFLANHLVLAAAAAALVVAIALTEARHAFRPWREVGPFELTQLVNAGAVLLDLRSHEQHRAGHIAGARSGALADLDALVKGAAKDAPVVLYTEAGTDCAKAAERLIKAGHTQVATLRGGLATWRTENLPLAKG